MQRSAQEFLWVAVPKSSGAVLQLVFNLFLLQYFGPHQFGVFAVCVSAIILADAVFGAAFDTAVLRQAPLYRETEPLRSLQIQQAGLLLKPAGALLALLPLVAFSDSLSRLLFQGHGSKELLYLTAAAVLGLLLLRSIQVHFQVGRKFHRYGAADIAYNVVRYGGTGLLLALHAATPGRVLALYAVTPVIAGALLATVARPLLRVPVSRDALREVLGLLKAYLPTAAIGSITSRMDLLFVTSLASVAQAGIFAAAQTLIIAPQLIGMYLGVVFSPRIMPLWKEGKLAPVYQRFQGLAILGCSVAYVVALVTMRPFVNAFLPASFWSATTVALVLLPAGLAAFVNFPWTVSFLLFLRPRFLLVFDLLGLPVLAVLYVFAVKDYGAMGAAVVTTAYALVKTAALQKVAGDILRQSPEAAGEQARLADRGLEPGV